MNDVRLLQFQTQTKDRYIDTILSEMKERGESRKEKLKALRDFLGKSTYFKGVISEDGFDLFVPKNFREDIGSEWFPVDPTFMTVVKKPEKKLIYEDRLKDLLQ